MCCFPHYTINPKFFQVKYSAPAECEIISFENCEISPAAYGFGRCEMKFAHIREANISHLRSKYFTAKLFHLPEGQISLKKAKSYDLAFFLVETTRFELVTPCMSSKYSNQLSYASDGLALLIIYYFESVVNLFFKIILCLCQFLFSYGNSDMNYNERYCHNCGAYVE